MIVNVENATILFLMLLQKIRHVKGSFFKIWVIILLIHGQSTIMWESIKAMEDLDHINCPRELYNWIVKVYSKWYQGLLASCNLVPAYTGIFQRIRILSWYDMMMLLAHCGLVPNIWVTEVCHHCIGYCFITCVATGHEMKSWTNAALSSIIQVWRKLRDIRC